MNSEAIIRSQDDMVDMMYELVVPVVHTIFWSMFKAFSDAYDNTADVDRDLKHSISLASTWNSMQVQDIASSWDNIADECVRLTHNIVKCSAYVKYASGLTSTPNVDFKASFAEILHAILICASRALVGNVSRNNVECVKTENALEEMTAIMREYKVVETAITSVSKNSILAVMHKNAVLERKKSQSLEQPEEYNDEKSEAELRAKARAKAKERAAARAAMEAEAEAEAEAEVYARAQAARVARARARAEEKARFEAEERARLEEEDARWQEEQQALKEERRRRRREAALAEEDAQAQALAEEEAKKVAAQNEADKLASEQEAARQHELEQQQAELDKAKTEEAIRETEKQQQMELELALERQEEDERVKQAEIDDAAFEAEEAKRMEQKYLSDENVEVTDKVANAIDDTVSDTVVEHVSDSQPQPVEEVVFKKVDVADLISSAGNKSNHVELSRAELKEQLRKEIAAEEMNKAQNRDAAMRNDSDERKERFVIVPKHSEDEHAGDANSGTEYQSNDQDTELDSSEKEWSEYDRIQRSVDLL